MVGTGPNTSVSMQLPLFDFLSAAQESTPESGPRGKPEQSWGPRLLRGTATPAKETTSGPSLAPSTTSGLGREGEAVQEAVRKGALKKGMFLKPKEEKRRGTGEKKMSIWKKKKKKGEKIGFGSKEFGETREIFLSLYPHLPSPPDPAPGPLKPSSPQE